jgi:hypothetical protein
MGNHSVPSKQTLKRTVAAGTIAGCSAVGLGALSTLAAPAANACFLGCHSTHNSTSNSSSGSGINVSVSNNNGNTTQSTGAFSGNNISPQFGLGVLTATGPTSTSVFTPITNVSALNGTGNLVTVVAAQTTTTTTTTTKTCTTALGGSVSC